MDPLSYTHGGASAAQRLAAIPTDLNESQKVNVESQPETLSHTHSLTHTKTSECCANCANIWGSLAIYLKPDTKPLNLTFKPCLIHL